MKILNSIIYSNNINCMDTIIKWLYIWILFMHILIYIVWIIDQSNKKNSI